MKTRIPMLVAALAGLALGCFETPEQLPTVGGRWPAELPDSVVIRDTGVLDVVSGEIATGRDVLLRDGVIAAIEASGRLTGALVVDGAGATLVPGLIDMHGHVNANSQPTWVQAFPDPDGNLLAYAYAGVTTVFDPADSTPDAFARRERVARREQVGPRIFTTGPLLTCTDGHPLAMVQEFAPWWLAWYILDFVATDVPDAASAKPIVDRIADAGADAIKIAMDRIPLDAPRMTTDVAAAVVRAANDRGLRVVAHIGTTQDAIDAAEAGVSLWVHGVYKEPIPEDEIGRLAGYDIPMVATIEVFDRYARALAGPFETIPIERETVPSEVTDSFYPPPDDFDLHGLTSWLELARQNRAAGVQIDNIRRLHEAGVTVLAGSDTQSGVFPGAGLHRELAHLVRAGFTPVEAIRAATLDPARFLANGGEPDSGVIAVGKRADLLLVDGDPTRDVAVLQNLREVFLAGVPIERTPVP